MLHRLVLLAGTLLVVIASTILCIHWEMDLDRYEQIGGFNMVNTSGMRVRKLNRTNWVLDGESEAFVDFGNELSFSLTVAHSTLGNNQFNEYPMKIFRAPLCEVLNRQYKEYQHYWLNWTNLPRVGDEWYCPFPKGKYYAKNYIPDPNWVPLVVPEGYWRWTIELTRSDGEVAVKYVTYMKLIRILVD